MISLERQTRIGVGLLVLTGSTLGAFVHPGFIGLAAFVGVGLVVAGITDFCGLTLVLSKAPWNRSLKAESTCAPRPANEKREAAAPNAV